MKRCHPHHLYVPEPREAFDTWRATNFDMLISRLNIPVMRLANPKALLIEYARPTVWTSWTKWYAGIDFGAARVDSAAYRQAICDGIKKHLDTYGADGVLIDTPQETNDTWRAVQLVSEIKAAIKPKALLLNTGDAWTWMGSTPEWKALTAICDWHFVEVFYDMARTTIVQFVPRAVAVNRALDNGKQIILGVYDDGREDSARAASLMANWPDKVCWSYKTSLDAWSAIPTG